MARASMYLCRPRVQLKGFVRRFRHTRGNVVTAIFVADAAGAPTRLCPDPRARRSSAGRRSLCVRPWHPSAHRRFEVTLTLAEGLRRAERRHSVPLDTGLHRRNLMLSGLLGTELRGRSLRIGEAPFEWHRVRPP